MAREDMLDRSIEALQQVSETYFSSKDLSNCVKKYAAAAAVAGMASGVLPGVGGVAATAINIGATWQCTSV